MSDRAPSPKRRHILSSFNPDAPAGSRGQSRDSSESRSINFEQKLTSNRSGTREKNEGQDPLRPRYSRLKLKDASRRRRHRHHGSQAYHPSRNDEPGETESLFASHTAGPRHHRRHRHRRRHTSPGPSSPDMNGPPPLDPETAFRESLFDAMADDEAASYWEHVYGQPIDVYSNERIGQQGELERMTDEEYAAHVRQKMYEKTHAGLLEDKARREERKKQKAKEEQERRRQQKESARHNRKLHRNMEQSLKRGEARKLRKEWAQLWARYAKSWTAWDGDVAKLPWPVREGQRRQLAEEDVRTFFIKGLDLDEAGEQGFANQLKEERVRWHPDKVQQRLGGTVDGDVMRDVTAVFQIIDRLWGELREKTGGLMGGYS